VLRHPSVISKEMVRNFSQVSTSVCTNLPNPRIFGDDTVFAEVNGTRYRVKEMNEFLMRMDGSKKTKEISN
jgi:hypothetical protein